MKTSTKLQAAILWLSCLLLAWVQPGAAQHVNELTPRDGEQRFNKFQYMTTHNSFERENGFDTPQTSIPAQLDLYNVWCIEFDLRWNDTTDDFHVMHACADGAGNNSLNYYLAQVNGSNRRQTGLTGLFFESGEIGPCITYTEIGFKPDGWETLLQTKIQDAFGSSVYTWEEFAADGWAWPSPQELLRRGKHIIPIITYSTDYFFGNHYESGAGVFFTNTDDEDTVIAPNDLGVRYLARWYPFGSICGINGSDNAGWSTAYNNNFSFPASNCSGVNAPGLHPPHPTFVADNTGTDSGGGTFLAPLRVANSLRRALQRVQDHQNVNGVSMVTVRLDAATYSAGARITTAVKLTSNGGTTRIVP